MASVLVALLLLVALVNGTELTFDMEPHEKQCFMEHVKQFADVTVEYQVCMYLVYTHKVLLFIIIIIIFFTQQKKKKKRNKKNLFNI